MKKKYELVVKGINNYPDKITVTVAPEIGGYPSLLLPDVAISLDRTEGATLEFYEAEAKKQAKQFFMDVAAGLCEGGWSVTGKASRNFRGAGCVDNLQRKTTGNNYGFSEDSTAGLKT